MRSHLLPSDKNSNSAHYGSRIGVNTESWEKPLFSREIAGQITRKNRRLPAVGVYPRRGIILQNARIAWAVLPGWAAGEGSLTAAALV